MAQVLDKETWQRDAKILKDAEWSDEKIMTYFKASGDKYLLDEGILPKTTPSGTYDYDTAIAAGITPDETGHWPSVAPLSNERIKELGLPPDSGIILKARSHPTFHKTIEGEASVNRHIETIGGRDFSVINDAKTLPSNNLLKAPELEPIQAGPSLLTIPVGGQIASREGIPREMGVVEGFQVGLAAGLAQEELFPLEFDEIVRGPDPDRTARMDELDKLISTDIEGKPFPTKVAIKSAEASPMLVGAVGTGAAFGTVAGTAGIAAGPGAPVSVPALTTVGFAAGAAHQAFIYETGAAYHELKKQGIDPEVAQPMAMGVGFVNALIEVSQIGLLLNVVPGGDRLKSLVTQKAASKLITSQSVQKILAKRTLKAGAVFGAEIGQEVVQELNNVAAVHVADAIDETVEIPDALKPRIKDTIVYTAQNASLSFLPMVGVSQTIAGAGDVVQNQRAKTFEDQVRRVQERNRRVMGEVVTEVVDEKFQEDVSQEVGPPTQAEVNLAVQDAVQKEKVIRLEGKSPIQEKVTRFETHLLQGKIPEAQTMLVEAKEALNENPESVELQAIEDHMLRRFKELDPAKKGVIPGAEALVLEGEESIGAFLQRVEPTPPIQKAPAKVTVRAKDKLASDKQIAKVHGMAEELGITPEDLDTRLQKQFGAPIAQLKGTQVGGLIGEFRRRTGTDKKPRPTRVKDTKVVTVGTEKSARVATRRLTDEGNIRLLDTIEAKNRAKIPSTREVEYRSDKSFVSEKKARRYLAELHKIADANRISKSPAIKVRDSFMGGTYNRVDTKQSAGVGLTREPRSAESMRYYMEGMGVRAGEPLGYLFDDLSILNRKLVRDQHNRYERLARAAGSEAEFKNIAQSDESLGRIGRWLASKTNLKNKPAEPTLNPTELAFAEEFQRIMKDFEVTVRLAKLNKRIFEGHVSKEFRNNANSRAQILEAEDTFHREGLEATKAKLKTQTWGTITGGGFEPMEMIDSFFTGGTRKFTGISEAHIRERGSTYTKQERNLMQRFRSYSRQMDMLAHAKPKLEAMRSTVKSAQRSGHIKKTKQLGQTMRLYEDNLLGNRSIELWAEEAAARAYNQALTAILQADVSKPFRNTFQSTAFYPDKTDFLRTDNRALTPTEMEYLRAHVSQMRVWDEFFMTDFRFPKEIPIPGTEITVRNLPFNALNAMADRANFYGWSDEIGRIQSFWAMLNRVERARLQMEKAVSKGMAPDKAFDKIFWKKTRMGTMTPHQQKRLMEIWANDGPEAMQLYRAKILVEDIHFMYEQTQRGVVEQTAQGKTFLKLANFPRAYTERLATQSKLMFTGEDFTTKFQGFKTTFNMTVPAMLVGQVFLAITGGDINPYDPLRILKWGPLGLIKDVVGLPFAVGADFATAIDPRVPKARRDQAFTRFTKGVARMPNMWLPFWRHIIGTLDVVTDTKDIDILAVKKFREVIDKEYEVRGGSHEVDRSALQMAQRIFGGRAIDRRIRLEDEEARKKEKARRKSTRGAKRKSPSRTRGKSR